MAGSGQRPVRLGDYELERPLGAGGMGEVFVARQGDQRVALKTLQRASSTNRLRFKNEFRALADVRHPNLVELYALGEEEGRSFYTMELLEDAEPFVGWVRRGVSPGAFPELGRLEVALVQLCQGIAEIHDHGYVHRDLKPSNVLVTAARRVVILDFGLISAVDGNEHALTRDGQILGTPSYMAPEQAASLPVGPPADVYAVGVMLYECLTGRLPIEGAAIEILAEKLLSLDTDAALANIPPRWRELCGSMLRRKPELRPGIADLVTGLDHPRGRDGRRRRAAPFVGREAELQQLWAAQANLDGGDEPKVVHLRGSSGQGKSVLLRRFVAELSGEGCLVLSGRCREQESIPYKGVDAIIDALALHLRRQPEVERTSLRPRSVAALVRMFPVLDELWPDATPDRLEPGELRGVAWAALREVIGGLAQRGPLALAIDDAQWSDLDSVRLLESLLDASRPAALLLVLVLRDDLGELEALRAIAASPVLGPSVARVLELGPLPEDDARALVTLLAGEARLPREPDRAALWADSIALRAKGSPFFITQLVFGAQDDPQSVEELDRLVERRLAQLDPAAHRLLAVIAVAGGPLSEALALALTSPADTATLQRLREQGLIVGSSLDGSDDARIETAHDRVREVMLASLEPAVRAGLHTALGEELLARRSKGDGLFRAVDQLDAGLGDDGHVRLDDERRLKLAELNRQAGIRARDSAAWGPAARYFDVAARLIEPWITGARAGGDHHQFCVDVMFGEAESRCMNEDEGWLDRTDELLRWSLSDTDYGRVLNLQARALNLQGRYLEASRRGIAALERLGVRVPRAPSLVRVFFTALWGWWAIRRIDRDALLAMPVVPPERARTRAAMDIAFEIMPAVFNVDANLSMWLMSHHAVMTVRHGYHDRTLPALAVFGMFIIAMFDIARAIRFYDACVAAGEQRVVGAIPMVSAQSVAHMVLFPHVRPLRQVAATLERLRRRSVELGDRRLAEFVSWHALAAMMDAGHHPLPEIMEISESWKRESENRDIFGYAQVMDYSVRCCEVLIHGPAERVFMDYDDKVPDVRNYKAARAMMVMTYLGDYGGVLSVCEAIERKVMRGSPHYFVTLVALSGSIANAECLSAAPARQRRRIHRRLHRYQRLLRRWATNVPENYAPMLDIAEAEHAGLSGHFDQATTLYERALEAADECGMVWLAGLAAERLARQAERRGHAILHEAALGRARGFYETWGAAALVRRIDAQLTSAHAERATTAAAAP
ncbi:MAG: protein kinase [Myxococcota bacterium]